MTIKANLPDDVAALAQEAAARQNQTLDQFVASAITNQISISKRALTIQERATRGNRESFRAILDRVPSVPPVPGDGL
jgi:uncharacterized protein (DUF1778 family)